MLRIFRVCVSLSPSFESIVDTMLSTTVVFIPGFQSFVPSTKSNFVQQWCEKHRYVFLTFNHDFSSANVSIRTWFKHFVSILSDQIPLDHSIFLIGASLGGWLAHLILIRDEIDVQLRSRIRGILTIGMSINGTEVWLNEISDEENRSNRNYIYRRPSVYSSTGFYEIPVSMLLDSKEFLLPIENDRIELNCENCTLIFLHGMIDEDVSYQKVIDYVRRLKIKSNGKIELRLIQDGDHRLSRLEDLQTIRFCLNEMSRDCQC